MSAMGDFFTQKISVLDGATATRLQALGMSADACMPDWVLKNPQPFHSIKRFDVEAGCDMLYAPTFGATAADFKLRGIRADVRKTNKALVELTREIAGSCAVGGDIAPIASEQPLSPDNATDIYTEQAAALEEAGVDFFAIETQRSLAECRAAVIAVRSVSEKPILCTFSPTNTVHSQNGEDLAAVLLSLQDMGVEAFGVNCCGNMGLIVRVLNKLRRYAAVPLAVKPAAGMPIRRDGFLRYSLTLPKMTAYLPRFIASGARLLGGCCGTDSSYIAAVRKAVDDAEQSSFVPAEAKAWAASPYRVVELTARMKITELEIDEDIVENAAIAEQTGSKLLRLVLRDEWELDTLQEVQDSISLPLAVHCEDEELLLRFLRLYNGKPVIL